MSTNIYSVIVNFVKVGELKANLYLAVYINLYPYLPHLLSDSDDVLRNMYVYDAVEYLWVSSI